MASSDSRNRELLTKLTGWVDDATAIVRDLHDVWDTYGDYYQGVQHEGLGLSDYDLLDWAPVNLIFSTVETCIPILADAAPLWYVKGLSEGMDQGLEEAMTDALQGIWYSRRVARQYKMALRDQLLRGTGFLKVWWNPDIGPVQHDVDGRGRMVQRRLGEIDVSWLDPYAVFPDPAARCIEECEWLALATDISAERAGRIWDKFDEKQAGLMEDDTERPTGWLGRSLAWVFGFGQLKQAVKRQVYRVWEVYHEGGRRLTVFSGHQVLWDGPNPTPGEAFPVVALPMCERGESFFGIPIAAQIKELQDKINKWHMMMTQHLRLMGKPTIWTNDQQAAQQLRENGGRPGAVVNTRGPDTKVDFISAPPLPAWTFTYGRELYEDVKTVTGVQDVVRGLRPGSVQSGIGIQQLQESALTRLRDISRDNSLQLERCGQIVLEFMQEKYTEDRRFAYQRGSSVVRGTVSPDMLRDERTSPEYAASELMGDDFVSDGAAAGEESIQVPREYRVVVETGNSLPLNSMAQAELAMRLYQLRGSDGQPPIDEEALLDAVKFVRRKEVLQRREERQAAMMQGQMAAMQQQQQMAMAQQGPMGAEAGPQMGAPEDFGAPPQQDPMAQLQSLLQPIMDLLSEEDQAVLIRIIEALLSGQELTEAQVGWLEALPPEVQMMLEEVLQALGLSFAAGPGATPAAAQAGVTAPAGPMGLV